MVVKVEVIGGDLGMRLRSGRPVEQYGQFVLVCDGTGQIVLCIDEAVLTSVPKHDKRPRFAALVESPAIPCVRRAMKVLRDNPRRLLQRYRRIYTCDPTLAAVHLRICQSPVANSWIRSPALCSKTKLVSMITSNKVGSPLQQQRVRFARQMRSALDLYGRGFNRIDHKEDGLREYMFSVAIENIQWPGYHTEKIVDCFLMGTVPIYCGDPLIGKVFNTDGILMLGPNTPPPTAALYQKMLPAVRDNFRRAQVCVMHPMARLLNHHLAQLPTIARLLTNT